MSLGHLGLVEGFDAGGGEVQRGGEFGGDGRDGGVDFGCGDLQAVGGEGEAVEFFGQGAEGRVAVGRARRR